MRLWLDKYRNRASCWLDQARSFTLRVQWCLCLMGISWFCLWSLGQWMGHPENASCLWIWLFPEFHILRAQGPPNKGCPYPKTLLICLDSSPGPPNTSFGSLQFPVIPFVLSWCFHAGFHRNIGEKICQLLKLWKNRVFSYAPTQSNFPKKIKSTRHVKWE